LPLSEHDPVEACTIVHTVAHVGEMWWAGTAVLLVVVASLTVTIRNFRSSAVLGTTIEPVHVHVGDIVVVVLHGGLRPRGLALQWIVLTLSIDVGVYGSSLVQWS